MGTGRHQGGGPSRELSGEQKHPGRRSGGTSQRKAEQLEEPAGRSQMFREKHWRNPEAGRGRDGEGQERAETLWEQAASSQRS